MRDVGGGDKERYDRYLKRIQGKPMGAVSVFTCRISLSQPSNTLKKVIEIEKEKRGKTRRPGPYLGTLEKREEKKP